MSQTRVNNLLKKAQEHNADSFVLFDRNNMRYFSEYTGEGATLITPNGCAIITDGRYTEQAKEQAPEFTIIKFPRGKFDATINDTAINFSVKDLCFEADIVTYDAYYSLKKELAQINLIPTTQVGNLLRMVKDKDELDIIMNAGKITDKLLAKAFELTKAGMSEKDLECELLYLMAKKHMAENAFDMIIAGGSHGSMPHAVTGNRILQNNEMITLDFGAALQGYKSDMTRTYSLGQPSQKMKDIYTIVQEAQGLAQEALKPGMACKDVDAIARDYITKAGYGENFGHGLGHGVGLNIHEFPSLGPTSKDVLGENMVVTVEPGIYLPGVGGVRIENTCIITADSSKPLFTSTTDMIII